MVKLFGTDGIRGIVNTEKMNPELAFRMGKAMAVFCLKRKLPGKIVVGRDTRESGQLLEDALIDGIISAGTDALVAGVIPTPSVAYLVSEQQAGAGIVISASHNDSTYNGLKPFKDGGIKLNDSEEAEIEDYISEYFAGQNEKKDYKAGNKIILESAKDKYIDFILGKFSEELKVRSFAYDKEADGISQGRTFSSLKLVLDCANGAEYEVAPAVFGKITNELSCIFNNPDGKNINENCGSQHTETLQREVLKNKADLGLAYDGDGDRVIVVDEKGEELTGDHVLYIIAKMLKVRGELDNDLVISTVMSNLGFVNSLVELGINHIATAVGDRNVLFEMKKNGAVLGGEESGHIICEKFHPAGDGLAGSLLLTAALQHFGKPLSELAAEVKMYPKVLINVKVKSKPELASIPEIDEIIKKIEETLGSDGRVLVRYSGTENLCRVMVEGRDEKDIESYADEIARSIKKHLG